MTAPQSPSAVPSFYARKLYALLQNTPGSADNNSAIFEAIPALRDADHWWQENKEILKDISSASDRVSLNTKAPPDRVEARHPISGQDQFLVATTDTKVSPFSVQHEQITTAQTNIKKDLAQPSKSQTEESEEQLKQLFFWCWRFYPELRDAGKLALINPAHRVLPDCPIPSYNSTVSALAGAMFPKEWQPEEPPQQPYLLLFTFSPVQEFIKASRKFTDFWAGSYILHYLSAKLCWYIAQQYGPDAVITPSLWGQEIIDALAAKSYSAFAETLKSKKIDPVTLFEQSASHSLVTAGFPNTITALVPGKEQAISLGKALKDELKTIWQDIAQQVRNHVKKQVIDYLSNEGIDKAWKECEQLFPQEEHETYKKELRQLQQHGCWEWNKLWTAQIDNTWQPYFVAVPLGHPDNQPVLDGSRPSKAWIKAQNEIALPVLPLPTKAEKDTFENLNVGTWWGSLQARLGQSMQAIKNTRRWQIPTAPGERSSLSGQFSALHPRLHYTGRFKHGRGMAAGSMRLFWQVMALAYPGLFDGSERLNALELTKRMAWVYGGVAESLGIEVSIEKKIISAHKSSHTRQTQRSYIEKRTRLLYERFARFPNLSSIAAGRFIHDHPEHSQQYWTLLEKEIQKTLPKHRRLYKLLTKVRPSNIPKTDLKLNPNRWKRHNLNGVMFSSKWLSQDLGLDKNDALKLRSVVGQTHQKMGFGESSPADWWVLLLADGDSMGSYVSGRKLKPYKEYVLEDLVDRTDISDDTWQDFLKTPKRMGPATHVGLNRALLDFSNRLVPHLTEHRYCGKVIYSGGDDVLVALPLADMPGFVRSLRAAWCGGEDPSGEFTHNDSGYWHPKESLKNVPNRPLFTMGEGATMSMGIVIAHKSVPLPTVLENLWEAEKDRAKKLLGGKLPTSDCSDHAIAPKDGLCFRVIYGSGNTLEALMKGHLLDDWWTIIEPYAIKENINSKAGTPDSNTDNSKRDNSDFDLSPVLLRLAEELPKHCTITPQHQLCYHAAKAIMMRREDKRLEKVQASILTWLSAWEAWAWSAQQTAKAQSTEAIGATLADLSALLKFTAFWISRQQQEQSWTKQTSTKEVTCV